MNKKIIIGSLFTIIITLFYFLFVQYRKSFKIENDSYIFTSNKLIEKLYINDLEEKESQIDYIKVKENEQVYSRSKKYYVGSENKIEIVKEYPIISVDGTRVTNMNEKMILIDQNFKGSSAYNNSILAEGSLYNATSYDKVDNKKYFLLNIQDKIFLNGTKITINNRTIPLNSIIYFMENEIRYYYLENGLFKYDKIVGINPDDIIYYFDRKINYEDLLINLEIIIKEEEAEDDFVIPEEIIPPKIENSDKPIEELPEEEYKYVKPEVISRILSTNVYSFKLNIEINDSARRIGTYPTFEIKYKGGVFLRKTFYTSDDFEISGLLPDSEFEVVGYFTYRNEKDKLLKKTFLTQTIKTKDIKSLEHVKFTYENKDLFSNKVKLDYIEFKNNKNDEVLKGIKDVQLVIGDNKFSLSNNIIAQLKRLQAVEYSTPTTLKSNTVYDSKIIITDIVDNELYVENGEFLLKTIKEKPTASINITDTDLTTVDASIQIINPDEVNLQNVFYVVTDDNNNIILKEQLIDKKINISDLDINIIYNISLYADYDLEDGNGIQKNVLLKTVKVSTKPLSTLGFVRFNLTEKTLTQHEAKYDLLINIANTDRKLLELLYRVHINVYIKGGKTPIKEFVIEDDDLSNLKAGILYDLDITDLYSNTDYTLEFSTDIKQGSKVYNIQGLSNINEFKTLKKSATVEIINKYSNESLIDFDARITDVDGAIESSRVLLYVRDKSDTLIGYKVLGINEDYVQLTYNKLNKEEDYTFEFIVEEYNEGYNNATYEEDKVLRKEIIHTNFGIYGTLELDSLLKEITSKNLFDISNNKRWKKEGNSTINSKNINMDTNIIKLSVKNGYGTYSYFLPEGKNRTLKVSFKIRHTTDSNMQDVYLSNGGGSNRQNLLDGLSTEWKEIKMLINLANNCYLGFYINEISNNNTITSIEIKDLNVELGSSETSSNISDSYYDNKYIFTNTVMLTGAQEMPNYNGTTPIKGNASNGFARITNLSNNQITSFSYTGAPQTFTVPTSGKYKIELWGAAGGDGGGANNMNSGSHAGRGGYTSGEINLDAGTNLYVYVGQKGAYGAGSNPYGGPAASWNGGGYGGNNQSGSGGGATDVRLKNGDWYNYESLKSRIMVAGAGGGADNWGGTYNGGDDGRGGHGGGIVAEGAYINGVLYSEYGGSQYLIDSTGTLGKGSNVTSNTDTGGGGGGYYGGGVSNNNNGGAGGGSSYISGYKGCISVVKQESLKFEYKEYSEKETLLATIYANIVDSKDELEKKEFYIQIIRDGVLEEINKHNFNELYNIDKMMLQYHLKTNASYEIRLAVKIRDRFYTINSLFFTTDEEIRTIKTINDFFNMHITGKYLVAEDLDFRESGSSYPSFSGKIDFQGHKVFMDVNGAPNELIRYVSPDGLIQNMDVHFYLNNTSPRSDYRGLFYDFRGKLSNIKITVEESTNVANVNFCLIAHTNRGIVENFVINNKTGLSGQRWTTLGMLNNYGTMRNGYVYGADINASFPTTYPQESKRVGALAGYAGENSRIENVFSLVAINGVNPNNTNNYDIDNRIGSIVGENNRSVYRNVYSYTAGENRVLTRDANIGNYGNVTQTNMFYVSDQIYNPIFSLKVAKKALRDPDFQNIINEDNMFNIDDYVPYGYYPHILWPDCMPNQEYINLPTVDDADLIDITHVKSTQLDGTQTLATLMVNNPNNELITGVGIKDIGNVEIVSQNTNNNKTTLVIKLLNPMKYISKYYVKNITAKSNYGKEYKREYKDNERVLLIDMYREINNEKDWLKINEYPDENFILTKDLDFNNMPYTKFQLSKVNATLNGNGHTIRNLEVTSGMGIINELRGKLINLNIENVKRTRDNNHDKNGIVGQAYTSSVIDNVHVKNITLFSYNRMGGLVGYGDGVVIRNSSVTNVKVADLTGKVDVKIGGIIGEGRNLTIENSYAQGIDFDVTTAKITYASGGIGGYIDSGNISNVYAVGNIESNSQNTGGLVGRNGTYIQNSYSNVSITSKSDYIGGIAGDASNTNIGNCLSVGSLYSYLNTKYIKRIAGNTGIENNNYAWDNQHINGKTQSTSDGEGLLTFEQLSDRLTYEEIIKMGSDFNYDDLENGKLPKLYKTDGITLLPNQIDNYLESYQFEVLSINVSKTITDARILFTIYNPDEYVIKNVFIDNAIVDIKKKHNQNRTTAFEILMTPERAFDSYKLSKIIYEDNGVEKTYKTDVRIDAQFYKDLEKYEDWLKISDTYAENYRVIADIDFDNRNINTNVLFNRLEGSGDTKRVLKNVTFSVNGDDQSLIKCINSHINNIEFNNININNAATGDIYRNGIIGYAFGIFENVDFKNITMNLPKSSNVACLVNDRTTDLRNIDLDYITSKGREYVGGFISRSFDKAITNIHISNADIYGTGQYVGSVIAHGDHYWTTSVFHISGEHLKVEGKSNYVGGIFGYGGGNYIDVVDANVTGYGTYIGGIAGDYHVGEGRYLTVSDSKINGYGSNIGGIAGSTYNLAYAYLINSKVYGLGSQSNNVGGIAGYGGYNIWYSGVKDSLIDATGDYVGGLKGLLSWSTVHSDYVKNTEVYGKRFVGGLVGGHQSVSNNIERCMTNAKVTARETSAGGALGFANNSQTNDTSYKIYIQKNIIDAEVHSPSLAGGLVGRMDKIPYNSHMNSNILSVSVNSTGTAKPGLVIGFNDYYSMNIPNLKIYNGSTINGTQVGDVNGIANDLYVNKNWLTVQNNYTDIGFSTSYFNFSKLSTGYYPYLTNQVSDKIEYFELPTGVVSTKYDYAYAQMMLEEEYLHILPEFEIYASDINAFNIEFDDIDEFTTLTVNGVDSKIINKVFTYNYGFNEDIIIKLSDGINEEEYTYKADELRNKVYIDEDKYYFVKDKKLITNNIQINEKVLNIFDGKVLLENGKVINLLDLESYDNTGTNFFKRTTIKPLFTFNYNDLNINTYYNYSTINNKEINNQVYVKNGQLEMISGGNSSIKESILIDNYNNNSYLVLLNKDGKIYNLKDKITFPKDFTNSKIIAMSNNLQSNTYYVGIVYDNGGLLVFDYRNGNIIFNDYKSSDNLIEYYVNTITDRKSNIETKVSASYKESKELIKKLDNVSITEYITQEKIPETKNYISVYNEVKQSYDVYDVTEFVNNSSNNYEELKISVNEKINSNASLTNYYYKEYSKKSRNIISSISIFLIILLGIIYSSLVLGRNIKKAI